MGAKRITRSLVCCLCLTAAFLLVPQLACALPEETQSLRVEIVGEFPHDTASFTQGLIWHDGALFESTGQYSQ